MKRSVIKEEFEEIPFDITYLKKLIESKDPMKFDLPQDLYEFRCCFPEISKEEILDNLEQIQELVNQNYECCKYNDLVYEIDNLILTLRNKYDYGFTNKEIIQAITEYLG